jgi:hypothetical protein
MWLPCLLHVCSDVPVLRGINRPQTVPRLGGLRVSCQHASVKVLVECENRIPEQRTLNPRVRSRWPSALSLSLRGLAAAARSTQRAGQRRSRLRYQGQRPSPFPMFRAPGKNQTRAASSLGTMQNIRRPGHAKSRPQVHRSYTPGQPQARGSGMAVHAPRAAGRSPQRPRPRNGNRMRCRYDSRTAAGGTTRRQPPRAARGREFPETIHPPRRHPRQQIGTQAPRYPPGTLGSRGTRVPERAPGSAPHAKPEWAPRGPCPWPSVEKPTVRTDRDGARIPSAMRPWTPRHSGPQRDKMTHHGTEKKRPA